MVFDSRFTEEFLDIVSSEQQEEITNEFIDPVLEAAHIDSLNQRIDDLKSGVPALDFESSIYNTVLSSAVGGINKYLEEKLLELKDEDNTNGVYLTYHPDSFYLSLGLPDTLVPPTYVPTYEGAPPIEVEGSRIKIPYQINFAYIDIDQKDDDRQAAVDPEDGPIPTSPTLRDPSTATPVTVDGDTRQRPGVRNIQEFFTEGVEIFFMQPLYESNSPTVITASPTYTLGEKKVSVINQFNDSTLASLIEEAKVIYDLFEELLNGVEIFSGSYTDSVSSYEEIIRLESSLDRYLLRNQILRELMGVS